MKTTILLLALTGAVVLSSAFAKDNTGLLPNASFEINAEGRPTGWRIFHNPENAKGDFFISAGNEGEDTHTGAAALQFRFAEGTDLLQSVWMADPNYGGMAVESGTYSCTFWIKASNLLEGFHTWVSIVGYDANKERTGELGRSSYLGKQDLTNATWTPDRFTFNVPEGVTRIGLSVVFKTHPNASMNPVPPTTQILIDDILIEKD